MLVIEPCLEIYDMYADFQLVGAKEKHGISISG